VRGTLRLFAVITALIGLTQAIFNALWIGRTAVPLDVPQFVSTFEVGWGFVAFAVLLRWRQNPPVTLLAGSYVIYTGFALVYTLLLGLRHGDVTEAMVPEWWKYVAVVVGVWLVIRALPLVARAADSEKQEATG